MAESSLVLHDPHTADREVIAAAGFLTSAARARDGRGPQRPARRPIEVSGTYRGR